jgi:hypothetical protein
VLQPNFDSSIRHRIKKNYFINHILDLHVDGLQTPKMESAELSDNLLREQQNKIEVAFLREINPLTSKINEMPSKHQKVNFVPRVKFENLNCCNFNLKEPLNWLVETTNEAKNLATDKHDEATNLIESVSCEISTPTIEHVTINSFKYCSMTEIMLYIYVAKTFSIICKRLSQKSVTLGHDHLKLNCLNFKPSLLKTPVPKLAPKTKLFHSKVHVKSSFKIQLKERVNCKSNFSTLYFDETDTNAQPSEMSIHALEANAPHAPDNAVQKSALECSSNEIPIRKVGLMVSTMNIKLGIPYFPKVEQLKYLSFNLMIDIFDKPYEHDMKYIHANIQKVQLNGWPPPVGLMEQNNF